MPRGRPFSVPDIRLIAGREYQSFRTPVSKERNRCDQCRGPLNGYPTFWIDMTPRGAHEQLCAPCMDDTAANSTKTQPGD